MVAEKIDQCMKPHGEEGIETIKNMNENHREISEFAFKCVNVNVNDEILDIGCGGGVNLEKFLKLTDGNVDGLDYSEVSVAESIKRNIDEVNEGRCDVIQADVSDMPISDESYDLVSAFETIYLNNARMSRLFEVGDELHSLGVLLYLLIFMCFLVNLGLLCVVF